VLCVTESSVEEFTGDDSTDSMRDLKNVHWLEPAPEWSAVRSGASYGFADIQLSAEALRFRYWHVTADEDHPFDEFVIQ
jgi:hypothetical protein